MQMVGYFYWALNEHNNNYMDSPNRDIDGIARCEVTVERRW